MTKDPDIIPPTHHVSLGGLAKMVDTMAADILALKVWIGLGDDAPSGPLTPEAGFPAVGREAEESIEVVKERLGTRGDRVGAPTSADWWSNIHRSGLWTAFTWSLGKYDRFIGTDGLPTEDAAIRALDTAVAAAGLYPPAPSPPSNLGPPPTITHAACCNRVRALLERWKWGEAHIDDVTYGLTFGHAFLCSRPQMAEIDAAWKGVAA
jgi:hypothetical protein